MDIYKETEVQNLYGQLKTLEMAELPMTDEERMTSAAGPLLSWYHENRRVLPWREEPEPYRVWISEIMLQQTRVEAVKPYFARFMERLPDASALAAVEEETLLKLWEGLGYYNRARNLKKAAGIMTEQYGKKPPASYEELLKLPGIGSYTAGAIASIAYGIPVPAVDGNVLRVLSRVLASREEIGKPSVKKGMEALLGRVMDREHPGDYNQALIELGALVCIPAGRPLCEKCPLSSICLAYRRKLTDEIPVKAEKKKRKTEEKTVFLIEWNDRAAIRKRADKGLLASLYEFPNLEGYVEAEDVGTVLAIPPQEILSIERLKNSVHIFTHIEWHMKGYRVILKREPELYQMVEKKEIFDKYPLPNAFSAYTNVLL